MKYLTTLEVARELKVSKQTLLNWLYSGKVAEPVRNKKGYRLWSSARLGLVRRLIDDGRIHKRTVVHSQSGDGSHAAAEFAKDVHRCLRDGEVDVETFVRELARLNRDVATHSQGMSGMKRRSSARPSRR